jgi:predicted transcriptional regulator YheO
MTKTTEVNEMLVTGLEIVLHHLRTEMDEITFRKNNLFERERELSAQIETTKARIASLLSK